MWRNLVIVFVTIVFTSCKTEEEKTQRLSQGMYRAELKVSDTEVLPFNFEVLDSQHLKVFNADEIIEVDEITYTKDSVYIRMPVFQSYLIAKIENDQLKGSYVKKDLNRVVPFSAEKNSTRFESPKQMKSRDIAGSWETTFSPGVEGEAYIAKGIFEQNGNRVTGTFRTTTGDYRYLEGIIEGDQLKLSTFDGSHAFLFTATITDSSMTGMFYSGNHWKEPFEAKFNPDYELPSAYELTSLNKGYESIAFSFPDAEGNLVSLSDARFKDKVVIIQIMGTWCPNCLDETKYYTQFHKENKGKDLEFIALAIEYVKTEEKAFRNIKRLKDHILSLIHI